MYRIVAVVTGVGLLFVSLGSVFLGVLSLIKSAGL